VFNLQLILADIDKAFFDLVHLSVMYFMRSVYLNLLSIIMNNYFILSTCSRWLLFRCISISFLELRLLLINNILIFWTLKF